MRRSPHSITCTLKRSAIKKGYSNPSGVIMLPRRTITSDWSWYIVSVIKKERECPGYSNVVSGTGDIVKEDNQEASFKGTSTRGSLESGSWGRITP